MDRINSVEIDLTSYFTGGTNSIMNGIVGGVGYEYTGWEIQTMGNSISELQSKAAQYFSGSFKTIVYGDDLGGYAAIYLNENQGNTGIPTIDGFITGCASSFGIQDTIDQEFTYLLALSIVFYYSQNIPFPSSLGSSPYQLQCTPNSPTSGTNPLYRSDELLYCPTDPMVTWMNIFAPLRSGGTWCNLIGYEVGEISSCPSNPYTNGVQINSLQWEFIRRVSRVESDVIIPGNDFENIWWGIFFIRCDIETRWSGGSIVGNSGTTYSLHPDDYHYLNSLSTSSPGVASSDGIQVATWLDMMNNPTSYTSLTYPIPSKQNGSGRSWITSNYQLTGSIKKPMISMHSVFDSGVGAMALSEYFNRVNLASKLSNFAHIYTTPQDNGPSGTHVSFSKYQVIQAVNTMNYWLSNPTSTGSTIESYYYSSSNWPSGSWFPKTISSSQGSSPFINPLPTQLTPNANLQRYFLPTATQDSTTISNSGISVYYGTYSTSNCNNLIGGFHYCDLIISYNPSTTTDVTIPGIIILSTDSTTILCNPTSVGTSFTNYYWGYSSQNCYQNYAIVSNSATGATYSKYCY